MNLKLGLFGKKQPLPNPAAELRLVTPVERLHGNCKEHVNSLTERLGAVIEDFDGEVRSRGGFVTRAEIAGTLQGLSIEYLTGKR